MKNKKLSIAIEVLTYIRKASTKIEKSFQQK